MDDGLARLSIRCGHLADEVRSGPQGRVDRLAHVARSQDQHVAELPSEAIEADEGRVDGPDNVNRIGLEAELRPVRRNGLDLIDQHDQRTDGGLLLEHLAEEVLHGTLAPSQRRARKSVRVELDVGEVADAAHDL